MTTRHRMLALGMLGAAALLAPLRAGLAAEGCGLAGSAEATAAALLDRYVAAVNARDAGTFAELFTDGYIQHSGRSPSGLAAQKELFARLNATLPDRQMHVEDRIIAGDKVVARTTYTATHTQPMLGFAPTGKPFTFHTIDIWRVENGKFAEHWDLTDAEAVLRKLTNGS